MSELRLQDLRGKTREEQFALAAAYAGVEPRIFDGIWSAESARGTQMLSPVGAEGHFGLMPPTRATWEGRLGHSINPNDFTESLLASAMTMRENMGRFGNVPDALRAYNGGWEPRRWNNPETRAYVGRVMGALPGGPARDTSSSPAPADVPDWRDDLPQAYDAEGKWQGGGIYEALATGQAFTAEEDAAGPRLPAPRPTDLQRNAVAISVATEGQGIRAQVVDRDAEVTVDATRSTWFAGDATSVDAASRAANNFGDRVAASWEENTILAAGLRMLDREVEEVDVGWIRNYSADLEAGLTYTEVKEVRGAMSQEHYDQILAQITDRRERATISAQGGVIEQTALGLATGFTDLPGWLLGAGVGKVAQLTGVGARAAFAGGNSLRGVAYSGLEGMVGNLAATGALDLMGEQVTTGDYAMSVGTGLLIGSGLSVPSAVGGFADRLATRGNTTVQAAAEREIGFALQAQTELGSAATPEGIAARVRELDLEDRALEIGAINAPTPDEHHLMPLGENAWLTADPVLKADVIQRNGLQNTADPTELDLFAEIAARAERFIAENPLSEGGRSTLLNLLRTSKEQRGAESTGLTLLASEVPALRMLGQTLLEGTTGAGGRRRSAAMSLTMRERAYRGFLPGYNDQFTIWRRGRGIGLLEASFSRRPRGDFDREVILDMNAQEFGYARSNNAQVRAAADSLADGFDRMRIDMQEVGTVGAARLGKGDRRGYFPRALSAGRAISLSVEEQSAIIKILSDQFMEFSAAARKSDIDTFVGPTAPGQLPPKLTHVWDRAFADKMAKSYLERGQRNAKGSYDVPVDLYSPEAAGMLEDTLKAAGRTKEEIDGLLGSLSRGGAGFTKQRLQIDLNADLPNGKKLIDVFDTDVTGQYSTYARRAAGEIALSQYGIHGRNGLKVIKQLAIQTSRDGKRATNGEIEALDQISAEILNTPFGDSLSAGAKAMDNIRMLAGMARLGGTGFTAFAETANSIGQIGVSRALAVIPELPKMMGEIRAAARGEKVNNPALNTIDTLGGGVLGADQYRLDNLLTTPGAEVEIFGAHNYNIVDRLIRAGANVHNAMSFNKGVTAATTRGVAHQINAKAWRFAATGGDDKALRDMGFDTALLAAMRADIKAGATIMKNGEYIGHDLKKTTMSPQQLDAYVQAVYRGASQGIQKGYVGEHNKWVHSSIMKLMTQFRSHPILAMEKQWGRNIAVHGAYGALGIIMGAMAFALPIHLARIQLRMVGMSKEDAEKYAEQNMTPGALVRSTMNYVSALGLYPDLVDGGMSLITGWGGEGAEVFAESIGARGTTNRKLIGGVVAPGVGWIQDVYSGLTGDPSKLMRSMPGATLPYITGPLNAIEAMGQEE